MGFLSKLKAFNEGRETNAIYDRIEKKLIADGKEHIIMQRMVIFTNKAGSEFPEFMAKQGYEVLDFDIVPSDYKNMSQVKVKYRSID